MADEVTRLERDLREVASRFDRHLEIYAQNGKELAALKSEVRGNHTMLENSIQQHHEVLLGQLTNLAEAIKTNTDNHVSHTEFKPVKSLVYGATAIILTAVVGGLVSLVVIVT